MLSESQDCEYEWNHDYDAGAAVKNYRGPSWRTENPNEQSHYSELWQGKCPSTDNFDDGLEASNSHDLAFGQVIDVCSIPAGNIDRNENCSCEIDKLCFT